MPEEWSRNDPASLLVVDDETNVRGMLATLLRREGYRVAEAASAEEALRALRRDSGIQLIISDLHMPGRDGTSLLREVRECLPDTPVIMLTGDGDVASAVECLKLGALDYMMKPFLPQEIRSKIAKALAERRLAIEVRHLRESYQRDLEARVKELGRKNQAMWLAQVQMAVTMLEAKDPYTRGHSTRVATHAAATSQVLGLPPRIVEEVRLGGELHDIGKIGTRDAVLHKDGPLTEEEFQHVRAHTIAGESMLEPLREDHPEVLQIVRWHHERVDGAGYPDGLRGEAIPLVARIVAVADTFDAIVSRRSYRAGRPHALAMEELLRVAGQQVDAVVVEAFRATFPDDE